jgi:hypothetical protein
MAGEDRRPADDTSIQGHDCLLVRIFPLEESLKDVNGTVRPNSGALRGRDKDEPLSADLGSLSSAQQTQDRGGHGQFHVVRISVADVRSVEGAPFRIVRDPLPDNPAHVLVMGTRTDAAGHLNGPLTKGEYKKLSSIATPVITVAPRDPELAG